METKPKRIIAVAILVVGVILGCLVWLLVRQNQATQEATQQIAELQLMKVQLHLTN